MTALFREDFEIDETKKQQLSKKLDDVVRIDYGTLITIDQMELIFGVDRTDQKEWAFKMLALMQIIRDRRFFCTSRGKEGALYILKRHEMASYNEKRNKAALRDVKARLQALYCIDASTLPTADQKRLEFETLRTGDLMIKMSEKLKERIK